MRATIRLALLGDAAIRAVLSKDNTQEPIIVANAGADGDLIQPTPHLILRMGAREPGIGQVFRRSLEVWAHDQPGDYGIIDGLLNRCRLVLEAIQAFHTEDGKWITCVEWQGDSEDLFDEGPGTITRNSSFLIIGSGG